MKAEFNPQHITRKFLSDLDKIGHDRAYQIPKSVQGNKDYYPYIPHNSESVMQAIKKALSFYNTFENCTFLEIGSGIGKMLVLANAMGFKTVRGVEVVPEYVKDGRKLFGLTAKQLICGDAFSLDHDFLKGFTIIYMYMPIMNRQLMSELFLHLINNSEFDTRFIEMLPDYFPLNIINTDYGVRASTGIIRGAYKRPKSIPASYVYSEPPETRSSGQ